MELISKAMQHRDMDLVVAVREDIAAYLEHMPELCFNERDLQMHLALWLGKSAHKYDDVDVEYYVPYQLLGADYIWHNEVRIDLIVRKEFEYLPIELKYKTKRIRKRINRFGESIPESIQVMKEQGAQDIGMYSFWKDVRRIELMNKRFEQVAGGIVLFMTNDKSYLNQTKETSNNFRLSLAQGSRAREKHWKNPYSYCAQNYPSFEVDKTYDIAWRTVNVEEVELYYNMLTIQ